jgi:hypothetical protein
MAIDGDVILNRFLAPQFSGDDNAHNSSRGAGVLGAPGITRWRGEMKLLAWKPKHGLAHEETAEVTKEAGKFSQQLHDSTRLFQRFCPLFSFHSSEIRARGFSGGIGVFFPVFFFFSGDRPGPCNWGCKRDL